MGSDAMKRNQLRSDATRRQSSARPRLAVVALSLIVILLLAGRSALQAADARPNVLFIAVDDLNDWVGFLEGHPQVKTPNMDRLAARGVVFANAHCAAPLCNPSRAAIFSGIQPFESGVYENDLDIRKVRPDRVLLPAHFKQAGYRTFGTGKLLHQTRTRACTTRSSSPSSAGARSPPRPSSTRRRN